MQPSGRRKRALHCLYPAVSASRGDWRWREGRRWRLEMLQSRRLPGLALIEGSSWGGDWVRAGLLQQPQQVSALEQKPTHRLWAAADGGAVLSASEQSILNCSTLFGAVLVGALSERASPHSGLINGDSRDPVQPGSRCNILPLRKLRISLCNGSGNSLILVISGGGPASG